MVTLQKSEKRKNHSNRVKITLKTCEKSFQSEWKSLQKSEFHFFFWESTEGQLFCSELSFFELPKKVKFTLLEWFSIFFGVIFTRFGMRVIIT